MKRYTILLSISYVISFAAIAISLWRCEPFKIDSVAVLANILALMVTILLGIIAYNYFNQKEEVEKFKKEIRDSLFNEVIDVYVSIMSSFGANKNSMGLFPFGVKVLERLNGDKAQDITLVCTLLNTCYMSMTVEEKSNPVIKNSLSQLSVVLKNHTNNASALELLAIIDNG